MKNTQYNQYRKVYNETKQKVKDIMDRLFCLYTNKDEDKLIILKRACAQRVVTFKEYEMCVEFFKDSGIYDELS